MYQRDRFDILEIDSMGYTNKLRGEYDNRQTDSFEIRRRNIYSKMREWGYESVLAEDQGEAVGESIELRFGRFWGYHGT